MPHPSTPLSTHPTLLQVIVNGDESNLCASGVRIVDAAGHELAVSSVQDSCTFVVSSHGCCRHGFAEMMAGA
jgi:hypothetical protein